MNVAADLRNFGLNAQLISRVGSDDLGRELLDFLEQKAASARLDSDRANAPDGRRQSQYLGYQRGDL